MSTIENRTMGPSLIGAHLRFLKRPEDLFDPRGERSESAPAQPTKLTVTGFRSLPAFPSFSVLAVPHQSHYPCAERFGGGARRIRQIVRRRFPEGLFDHWQNALDR